MLRPRLGENGNMMQQNLIGKTLKEENYQLSKNNLFLQDNTKKEGKVKRGNAKFRPRSISNSIGKINNKNCRGSTERSKKEKEEIRERAIEMAGEALASISNSTRANITKYVRDNKKATFEQLRKYFNLNNNTLSFHLKRLQETNILIQRTEKGPYEIGDLGNEVLTYLKTLEELSHELLYDKK